MNNDFDTLFEKAAVIHGHKCPSLFYGVSFGLLANKEIDIDTEIIILEGSSKCIQEGITCVLQEYGLMDKLKVIKNSSACALTLGSSNHVRRFILSPKVRQIINQWNKELPLKEFQIKGVDYLLKLKTEELLREEIVSREQYENFLIKLWNL